MCGYTGAIPLRGDTSGSPPEPEEVTDMAITVYSKPEEEDSHLGDFIPDDDVPGAAFLTFSSTIERILILFTEIIAVSANKKNPESRTRMKSTIMCIASLGSKSSSP